MTETRLKKTFDLPYEKFQKYGEKALTDVELLAIIIRTGTKEKSAIMLAEEILTVYGEKEPSLLNLNAFTYEELLKIKGIGSVKAVKIKCILELARRIWESRFTQGISFRSPKDIAAYYMEELRHQKQEVVLLLLLDNKSRLLKKQELFKGSVNTSVLSAREVCIQALKAEAVYMILLHNHPSGDPSPSKKDIEISLNLKQIGDLIEIPLLDHIIIGDNCYTSLREQEIL